MKAVLAFGDSLTFGYATPDGMRHPYEMRWPSVLEAGLGGAARVIPEGLNGRTTMFNDYAAACDRNGAVLLPTLLSTHTPLDAVIIMLGTNDLKPFICGTALGATNGMRRLAQIVATHPYDAGGRAPKLVIVSPPLCGPTDTPSGMPAQDRLISESEKLAGLYRQVAEENGAAFFDAATVAKPVRADGVHIDAENTVNIGRALIPILRTVLGVA